MPLYLYKCPECGYEEEFLQNFSDPPPLCPNGCEIMVRQLSKNTGFIFKGRGFFRTDYQKLKGGKTDEEPKKSESKDTI